MDALLKNTFTQISPAYQLVHDYTVSGSAITSYDFTGLNITKEDDYMLVSNINLDFNVSNDYSIYANANYTATNYWRQELYASGSSYGANRVNAPYFAYLNQASNKDLSITKIKLANNGNIVFQTSSNLYFFNGNWGNIAIRYVSSTFTATSITSMRISSTASSGLGIGSRFQLYKRVAPIVYDYTVTSATTNIDITGLSIDKGSEYMLVSDVVNNSGSNSNISLCINNNTTQTNYYVQDMVAYNTSIGAGRMNNPYYDFVANNNRTLAYSDIKLTNNGYYTCQSKTIREYGTSSIIIHNFNLASIFTSSSITSLNIIANISNAIGVGSRFQLIKLK